MTDDDGHAFSLLALHLGEQRGESVAARMIGAFAATVGAQGAALAVGTEPSLRRVDLATDPGVRWLEELQEQLGEGPSLEAVRRAEVVETSDPRSWSRWPTLRASLPDTPHVVAFPVRPGGEVRAVLTAYAREAFELAVERRHGQLLANAVGALLLSGSSADVDDPELWSVRDRIAAATGMVVAQTGLAPDDALSLIRARAFAEDQSLSYVSGEIIDRRSRFDTWESPR